MTTRKPQGAKGKGSTAASPEVVFDRRLMEQHLAAVGRLLADKEFDSIEEANAYLQQAMAGGDLLAPGPTTPLEVNPFVPLYLLGVDRLPKQLPEYYSPGERNEAIVYMMEGADGWLETRGALEWLGKSMVRLAVSSAKPRRRRT